MQNSLLDFRSHLEIVNSDTPYRYCGTNLESWYEVRSQVITHYQLLITNYPNVHPETRDSAIWC